MGRATRSLRAGSRITGVLIATTAVAAFLSFSTAPGADSTGTHVAPVENAAPTADNAVLLTVFFSTTIASAGRTDA